MKTLLKTLIVLFTFTLMSCGGGDDPPAGDTTKPTITITSPTSSTDVTAGNNLNVNVSLADDVELGSFIATIAYVGPKSMKNVEGFSYDSRSATGVPAISGKEASVNYDVPIPANAQPGNYKLTITAKDKSNNEATKDVTFGIR